MKMAACSTGPDNCRSGNDADTTNSEKAGPWDTTVPTFALRFPSLSGRLLQGQARARYVIAENVTLAFFEGDSAQGSFHGRERLLYRDPMNRDGKASNRKKTKEGILKYGYMKGARNESLAKPVIKDDAEAAAVVVAIMAAVKAGKPVVMKATMAGGAHVMEAYYDALAEEPNNLQAIALRCAA